MSKDQEENARNSLIKLRGKENQDLINHELNRISLSLRCLAKENDQDSADEKPKGFLSMVPRSRSFWQPFSFLTLTFLALQWSGLPAIGFYMVSLLVKSDVPIDPYWASAMIASYRALVSILGSTVNARYRRRPVYLTCCCIFIVGLISLATYLYFNEDGTLTEEYSIAKWIPIFSIMIIYTGFALGFATIPFMLQVNRIIK